jgi:hypothetical protein
MFKIFTVQTGSDPKAGYSSGFATGAENAFLGENRSLFELRDEIKIGTLTPPLI